MIRVALSRKNTRNFELRQERHLSFSDETTERKTDRRTPAKRPPGGEDGRIFFHKKHLGAAPMELNWSLSRRATKVSSLRDFYVCCLFFLKKMNDSVGFEWRPQVPGYPTFAGAGLVRMKTLPIAH
ncbi:MAG: hypothetical protein D6714_09520 [Bacteroidetes bacterium]|nr:MAG: hypothetical protein D6714_09520 [Bacteroidota bacterium]